MPAGRRLPVKPWIVAGVVLLVLGLAAVTVKSPFKTPVPIRVSFTENAIQAFDAKGQNIWTHTFPRPFIPGFGGTSGRDLPYFAHVVDLLGDGEPKVLMLAPFFLDRAEIAMEVDCFSSRGDLLWSYVPHESLQFGSRVQPGGWSVIDILVSHDGPKARIWVIVSDQTWGDSYVAELDSAAGRPTLRYVNPGSLTMLNEFKTPAATFLLVTGYNNEYSRGTLAAIDKRKSFAASPQTASKYKCANCPAGEPDYYFVYPQSEVNEVTRELINAVGSVEVLGRQVQISKFELHTVGSMRTIYTLTPENATAPQSILYSSDYDAEHAELQRKGVIKHSLKECPERMHPKPIRMWSPATGWTELTVTRQ